MAKLNNELTLSVTNNFKKQLEVVQIDLTSLIEGNYIINKLTGAKRRYSGDALVAKKAELKHRYDMYDFLAQTSLTNYNKQVGYFVSRTMDLLFERSMFKARTKALGLGYSTIELNSNYEDIKQLAYIRCMEYLQALEDMQKEAYLFDAIKPTNTTFYSEERDDDDELIVITIYDCLPPMYIYFGLINVCFGAINHHLKSKRTCTLLNTYTHKENVALDAMKDGDNVDGYERLIGTLETSAYRHGFTVVSEFIEYMRSALTPSQYHAITKAVASDTDTSRSQLARARKALANDEYFASMPYEDKLQACHDLLQSGGGLSLFMNASEAIKAM